MSDELILAIDAGTQSIRAGLVDRDGQIHSFVKTPIEPYIQAEPGRAEQDPEYYWERLCHTTQQLLNESPSANIAAVTLTTQRLTMIALDETGKPLTPAIVWLDWRKADYKKIVPSWLRAAVKIIGLSPIVKFAAEHSRSNWWKINQPEIWNRTSHYVYLSGFFTHRLTGEFNDSVGNMIGTIPFNVKKSNWVSRFDIKWKIFPIEKSKLPTLVEQTQIQGRITEQASGQTGIPAGLPLIAASNDKACDLLGAGCFTPETACISFGTTATINTHTNKYVEVIKMIPPYPSAVPGGFYTEISVTRGLWMVSWFKDEFGLQEKLMSSESGIPAEVLLEELIKDVPAGSMGLLVQPHWTPGPNDEQYTKGAVIGFSDVHTRAHLYRAILEGIIFALKAGAELTEKKNKVPITRIHATGGGSRSDAIMQMTADILGLPTYRTETPETSVIGAAIDGAVGLGWYRNAETAAAAMTHISDVFEPNPDSQALYEQLYRRVYLKTYQTLLPLNKEIQSITGYPKL